VTIQTTEPVWKKFFLLVQNLNFSKSQGQMAMTSDWESKGRWFEPWRIKATFDPRLPPCQNVTSFSVPLIKRFDWGALKD